MTDQTIGNDVDSDDQWIFSEEEVKRSPSVEHGISSEDERIRRAKGVNFLGQAGLLLQLPPHVLGSAAVFFHRFYMRCSMVPEKGGIHHYVCAMLVCIGAITDLDISRVLQLQLCSWPPKRLSTTARPRKS